MGGLRQNRTQDPMTLDTSLKGDEKTIQDVDPKSRGLREAEQKIRILHEITRAVSSLLDLQSVLDAIVRLLMEEFKLDACSIRLLDSDGKLRIKSQEGLSKAFLEEATREPTIESYSGDCFLTGRIRHCQRCGPNGKTHLNESHSLREYQVLCGHAYKG